MTISRRLFMGQAAAAGLSLPLHGGRSPVADTPTSALATGTPVPLPAPEVAGFLSKEQLRWHHESHYGGALKSFNKLDADPVGDHRVRIAKANSVLLHELYFANMTSDNTEPGTATQSVLASRFGTLDRWIEDFRAAAKSCRGWAVLAWHPVNGKLYNTCSDSHDNGPVWSGVPLVVVDMYEHSYYIDYQNRKSDYVSGFTDHINWKSVENRLQACEG